MFALLEELKHFIQIWSSTGKLFSTSGLLYILHLGHCPSVAHTAGESGAPALKCD